MANVLRTDLRGTKIEVERPSQKAIIQVRDSSGLDKGNDSGTWKKRSDSGQILMVKPTKFPDELNEGWERKQGVRFQPEQLERMELPPTDLEKDMDRTGLEGRLEVQFRTCKFEIPISSPSAAG